MPSTWLYQHDYFGFWSVQGADLFVIPGFTYSTPGYGLEGPVLLCTGTYTGQGLLWVVAPDPSYPLNFPWDDEDNAAVMFAVGEEEK